MARNVGLPGVAALTMSLGFLFSASLHDALDFDFHPELMGFFFVFLALYYLVAARPIATIASLLPLLLMKEDMPLILGAFAVLLFVRGFRREGMVLFGVAAAYAVGAVLVLMPAIRGGPGDLTQRYGYLFADSTWWSILPHAVSRSLYHLGGGPFAAVLRLAESIGFIGFLSPIALLAAAPVFLLAALSDHPQQSQLELHYAMAPLALAWVSAVLGVERVAPGSWPRWMPLPRDRSLVAAAAGLVVLASSVVTFVMWSPYAPGAERYAPGASHRAVVRDALALVPADVSVSAQNTLLPHLSRRKAIFEFPELHGAEYVVVDPSLPVTGQARGAGYAGKIANLPELGYELVFDHDGGKVFRRVR